MPPAAVSRPLNDSAPSVVNSQVAGDTHATYGTDANELFQIYDGTSRSVDNSPLGDSMSPVHGVLGHKSESSLPSTSNRTDYELGNGYDDLLETVKLLFCGGFAGAVSKTATAPLARLTILYQVQGISSVYSPYSNMSLVNGKHISHQDVNSFANRNGVFQGLRFIVKTEGIKSLWKGNGVTIVHRIPYSAANFWAYEKINEMWKEYIPARGPLSSADVTRRLVAGGTAGLLACTIAYPLDLIRTRLAAQSKHMYYSGVIDAFTKITREEGPIGLYRGLGATLMQVAPSLAINYAAYETARSVWLTHTNESVPTVGMSLTCGSVAGLVSSTMTFPLDLVRRRIQLQGNSRSSKVYGSYAGAFKDIIMNEGWKGLYSGILPEYYKVIPGVAIAFCAYEIMKMSLKVETNATER